MRSPIRPCLLLGAVLAAASGSAYADLDANTEVGKTLLHEGDTLADKGETTEAVIRYKRAFEQLLPGLRKLHFKHEVKRDVTAREDMPKMLLKEFDEEMTPAEFRTYELGMKALGLVPRQLDLKATWIKVLSEEIGAFYDTKTKTMHLIKEPEAKAKKPPTFLERLLGKPQGFDKDENKTVIAHELTHALADQNFNLDKLQKAIKQDDDRDMALSALIEGEATLAMIGAQMEDWNGTKTSSLPSARLERFFSILIPFMHLAGGASLRTAPPIMSESMIFPYLRGMVFCARLTNDGGWPALDAAYLQPPLSTEQILHPEKYNTTRPDHPTAVDLGTLEPGGEWREVGRNVVGEMQLAVMLKSHGGKPAAAGWDGDRYAVFEGPRDRLGLVWFSTWDSPDDAREFAASYARFQASKLAGRGPGEAAPATYVVDCRGTDVVVVEGFSAEETPRLVEAAFRAKKHEMTPGGLARQAAPH
jgi:hypothetical protein